MTDTVRFVLAVGTTVVLLSILRRMIKQAPVSVATGWPGQVPAPMPSDPYSGIVTV